jgi:aspartate racemase
VGRNPHNYVISEFMKTIGLIGGVSWQSTIEYYRIINELISQKLGSTHSAKLALISLDLFEIEKPCHDEQWDSVKENLSIAARQLEKSGADLFLICANTLHIVADEVQQSVDIPLLHITDVTAQAINKQELKSVGLLGTRFTMEHPFYKERLKTHYDISSLVPSKKDGDLIHHIIYKELIFGNIHSESRRAVSKVIDSLEHQGAQGLILGCTELPALINQGDISLPLFDTTYLHAKAAVDMSLQ